MHACMLHVRTLAEPPITFMLSDSRFWRSRRGALDILLASAMNDGPGTEIGAIREQWCEIRCLTIARAIDSAHLQDIGSLASWSVSSSKPYFGVEHLSDPDIRTLWQYVMMRPADLSAS